MKAGDGEFFPDGGEVGVGKEGFAFGVEAAEAIEDALNQAAQPGDKAVLPDVRMFLADLVEGGN